MKKILLIIVSLFCSLSVKADDLSLLTAFYTTITEKHADPVSAEKITVEGLSALTEVDKDLLFANGKEMVYLYYKRRQSDLWKKPENANDIAAWVDICQQVLNKAIEISPKASERDFELIEKFMAATAKSLDDNSRYYSELETVADEMPNTRLPFARRMIDDVLYIKIAAFTPSTKQNVLASLKDYPDAKGIIVDLRGNKGGLLTAAIDVANIFIDGGIIASVKGRNENSVRYYNADENSNVNVPVVTLIDGNTASSAEVVAAALLEQIQAKLIGTNSFGKGSIQEMYRFENGGKLALTTAYFYTPSGQKIDKIGLIPDYCTYNTEKDGLIDRASAFTNLQCDKQDRERAESDIELAVSVLN